MPINNIHDLQFYLGSSSPRRQELMAQLQLSFDVISPDIDENIQMQEKPLEYVERMATEKACAVVEYCQQNKLAYRPVIAADTSVVVSGEDTEQILGKPESQAHAKAMLQLLANNTHSVYSSIALMYKQAATDNDAQAWLCKTTTSVTKVSFGEITDAEIAAYWLSEEPLGKAGGYAIQGRAAQFITGIEGSYTGVVGLPLFELKQLISNNLLKQTAKASDL